MFELEELDRKIAAVLPQVISLRHELHTMPELAGLEVKTSALLRKKLAELPLEVEQPYLGTDVIAMLNRGKPRNLTLRADIDALPLEEKNAFPYVSRHNGKMHACGHDGHAAMLWGAAKILCEMHEQIQTSIRFLFQPGEEAAGLARRVLSSGALADPKPDFITGLHSWPQEPYGKICAKPGAMMAAAGFFKIVLRGTGGHGSLPALTHNPLDCAAEIVENCRCSNREDWVLTFCHLEGGKNTIVIPDTVCLEGTIRFLDQAMGLRLAQKFEENVREICERHHVKCDFQCPIPYPVLAHNPEDFQRVRRLVEEKLGMNAFYELPRHVMSSEDFACYLQEFPGVFCHIGSGDSPALHSCHFDFDDTLLPVGMRYFCLMALEFLSGEE